MQAAPCGRPWPAASDAAAEAAGDARRPERLEVGLAREAGIERFEPPRGVEQQRHGVRGASQVQGDLPVEPLEHGALELLERPVSRQRERAINASCGAPASCLASAASSARRARLARVERELGSPLKERSGRGQSAARLRPRGRALELVGDLFVGRDRGTSEVPGAAIGVDLGIGGRTPAPDARLADHRPSAAR